MKVGCIISSSFYQLQCILAIRKSILTTTIQLVNNFVMSRVNYCNSLMVRFPACQLEQVQSILKSAARLVYS